MRTVFNFRLKISNFFLFLKLTGFTFFFVLAIPAIGQNQPFGFNKNSFVYTVKHKGYFTLAHDGQSAPIVLDKEAFPGVKLIVNQYFIKDVRHVTHSTPKVYIDKVPASNDIILVGTVGRSPLIDKLVKQKKINISDLKGKWEATLTQVVNNPFPGVKKALVVVGSDKQGTLYGLFDISRYIGISPWVWWADVPPQVHPSLYIKPGRYYTGPPKVKYRGIFLNDEEPSLGRWAVQKYGGFNHKFYKKVFVLLLRLRGNYLWPAMWWASFNSDDTLNPYLANELGIVMGTSHHEPMMRAWAEWKKDGIGPWNYQTNAKELEKFWKKGIERMDSKQSIVTIGMRGNGDKPMSKGTNIALLEKIVSEQRKIIAEVTKKPAKDTPQVWALYKEVQKYYDDGMRVPGDVTLLYSDDNWGNIRRLPPPDSLSRTGGYGIYYHFDYVGGPRNYKWINTNSLPRVWEQLHMAYEHGVKRIWIVNVGDLKPMELPISFFFDYAWNPNSISRDDVYPYIVNWATEQFGPKYARQIAHMLLLYPKYNYRPKPELWSPKIYSLNHFNEFQRINDQYHQLAKEAKIIGSKLAPKYRNAYFELVGYPVLASANLMDLYYAAAMNHQAAREGRSTANDWADTVRVRFKRDAALSRFYNDSLANGKWHHMMDQTHIGYTYWQQPRHNNMPKLKEITLPQKTQMGVAIEGCNAFWTEGKADSLLPEMSVFNKQRDYIDLFNRGKKAFDYKIRTGKSWLKARPSKGKIDKIQRIWLSADWNHVPYGKHFVTVKIKQLHGKEITVTAVVNRPEKPDLKTFHGFIESNGYVSMNAADYSKNVAVKGIQWKIIPHMGRTLSAVSPFPVTAKLQIPGKGPHLEYDMYLYHAGAVKVNLYLSPSLNYFDNKGLELAVSFDNQKPQVIYMNKEHGGRTWAKRVIENINEQTVNLHLDKPGKHILKIWMITMGVDLQKIVVETRPQKSTFLGPPESFHTQH